MINKSEIKLINSLKRKKFRDELELFVVEGVKNVNELIASDFEMEKIFATSDWEGNSDFEAISQKDLERISNLSNPNKVLALVKKKKDLSIDYNSTSIVVDNVNDPGNLGTIIRTADWFGINQIICSKESVDAYNPKVVMSTMGSIFRTKIFYCDLTSFFKESPLPVYGALLDGNSIYETNFDKSSLLFLGNESHGISEDLIPYINHKTTIPGSGTTESLNLGVSCAIFTSEYFRQTKTK